nr:hypothetical protein [Tanacetum cinerariifolium]
MAELRQVEKLHEAKTGTANTDKGTKGAGFCGREWGEVMESRDSGGKGAGSGDEGVAGLAGVVGTITVGLKS